MVQVEWIDPNKNLYFTNHWLAKFSLSAALDAVVVVDDDDDDDEFCCWAGGGGGVAVCCGVPEPEKKNEYGEMQLDWLD